MEKRESVILAYARTPFGKFGGALRPLEATELGGIAIRGAIDRAGINDSDIDYVLMGNVLQAGEGQIPSRQATRAAGLDWSVPSQTINKVCASSFTAVTLADMMIRAGNIDLAIAGGMESMSNAPFASKDMRWGHRMFNAEFKDLMVTDGLWDPWYDQHMGSSAGKTAAEYKISRQEQDRWAAISQQRAQDAMEAGRLDEDIVPVEVPQRKGDPIIVDKDEQARKGVTEETLSKLSGLFFKENTVTAGNAPATNDGASALVIASRAKAEELGIKPLATIVDTAWVSKDSPYIVDVPGESIKKLLEANDLTVDDIDVFEVNEAFAAVVNRTQQIVAIPDEKLNVNGGAIAFGHPIGATGGRIIMQLVSAMKQRNAKLGVAAICSGGAQGDAVLIRMED